MTGTWCWQRGGGRGSHRERVGSGVVRFQSGLDVGWEEEAERREGRRGGCSGARSGDREPRECRGNGAEAGAVGRGHKERAAAQLFPGILTQEEPEATAWRVKMDRRVSLGQESETATGTTVGLGRAPG